MDDDLSSMTRETLIAEVLKLRAAIRAHRDGSGQDLCWHHPQLWGLLPEPIPQGYRRAEVASVPARVRSLSRVLGS